MSTLEKNKKSVAWEVTEESEGHGCIVFHHHGLAARRNGANELNSEFENVTSKRAPAFDSYAEKGFVPTKVLIESGWWYSCLECGHKVHQDDEVNEPADYVYVSQHVYCSTSCQHQRDKTIEDQKIKFESFKHLIKEKRPDLEFTDFHGSYPNITMSAHFSFEGGKHKGSVKCEELDELRWTVAHGDLQAWTDYDLTRKPETSKISD